MHKPYTENISWMSSFGLYRACQKGETKAKLTTGITHFIIMVLNCKKGIFKEYFKFICVQQSFWIWSPQSTCKEQVPEWEDTKDASAPDRGGAWLGPVSWHSLLQKQGSHTSVQLLHPTAGQERKHEEKSKKLTGQNIDGEITYQVLLGAKQTQLREFNLLFWGKSWQTLTCLSSKFPRVNSLQALLCSLVTTASASQSLQGGRG